MKIMIEKELKLLSWSDLNFINRALDAFIDIELEGRRGILAARDENYNDQAERAYIAATVTDIKNSLRTLER